MTWDDFSIFGCGVLVGGFVALVLSAVAVGQIEDDLIACDHRLSAAVTEVDTLRVLLDDKVCRALLREGE